MYAYAYLAIIVLFSSCTPYLRVKPLTSHTYKIDRRCTQGPLVFRETIYGARWGEKIVLRVQTRKKADFHVDVVVGSKKRWPLRHHNVPENKWCLAQNGGGKANQDLSGGPAKGIPQPPAGTPAAPAGGFNPGTPGGRDHLTLIPVPRGKAPVQYYGINDFQNGNLRTNSRPGKHLYDTLIVDYKNKSLDPKPIYPKGTPVVITLWSKVPNDFEGAYFEIVHWRYNPNDTPKWIAHLKKQEEKRLRVREKARRQYEEEMRRRRHRALKICYILKSSAVTWKLCRQFTDNDTRRACVLKGPYYKPCWGTHLTSVTRERMKKPKPLPVRVVKVVKQKPAVAPKPRPVVKNPTPVVKRIPEPTGPPPQPLKDKRPPKPSLNAAWVHGFYKWNGAAWYWFHGFWRVPQKDILARKTQKAPKLPPPPRVELTTPPPYPGAVYTKGYWMWSGGRFIWIPGRWALPRGLQYRWQPPRWQRTPHGIYFVPGGWVPR